MLESRKFATIKTGSDRAFALTFAVVFLFISGWPMLSGGAPRLWSLAVAVVLAVAGWLRPSIFSLPNRLWLKLGMLLGILVTPIVMLVVYSIVILPTGLTLKLFRYDPLHRRIDPEASSYWMARKEQPGSMTNQF